MTPCDGGAATSPRRGFLFDEIMRDLKVDTSLNLGNQMEFNHLRISNLDEFLDSYYNKTSFYSRPWDIIARLESKIAYENEPDQGYIIDYKPNDGYICFMLISIHIDKNDRRIVTYEYLGSAS